MRVAWYRLRTTWHVRWRGYVAVAALLGAVGGLGIASLMGARRTQSAFPAYLASTHASDLQVTIISSSSTDPGAYSPAITKLIAGQAHVRHVAGFVNVFAAPLRADGTPDLPAALQNNQVTTIAPVNGEYFDQDRVAVAQGRMANPSRADEFVVTAQAARLLGWHVGQVLPFGVFTIAQTNLPDFGTPRVQPLVRIAARLVGIVVFNNQVVRDQVDQYPTFVLFTPTFTQRVLSNASYYPTYALGLERGSRDVTTVEQEIIGHLPSGDAYNFHVTSVVAAQAERATKPESIALGIFGLIALVAALLIAIQALGRQLQTNRDDLDVLRALGADTVMTTADGLPGAVGAIIVGAVIATGVAIALSPITLIGPIRQLERSPGMAIDWTVLGAGTVTLIAVLTVATVAMAYRNGPQRSVVQRRRRSVPPTSRLAGAAGAAGLPPTAVTGLRFALERGRGQRAAPVRSALLGAVLAVAVVAVTLTFGSGLRTLVSHPALYGWNWHYAIEQAGGGKFPKVGQDLLTHDPAVAAWTGYNFADVQINGQTVPVLAGQPNAALNPSTVSGHPLEAPNQIVVGAVTLAQLHKHIGDTVMVSYGSPASGRTYIPPTPLVIVGTATLPAVGNEGTLHVSMGNGAIVADSVASKVNRALANPDPLQNGVRLAVIRLRSNTSPAAGLVSLQRIAATVTQLLANDKNAGGGTFVVLPVQQPAEIVTYQHDGSPSALLAGGLAAGAVIALALTLAASVRRRRHDLALLKTIGFTQRQLLATIAWQASVAAAIGLVVGVPVGIGVGRQLWILFAREIHVVPQPTVPWVQIALLALGALTLANAAALLPGRSAARTPTALLLTVE